MTITERIGEYVARQDERVPIFADDIFAHVAAGMPGIRRDKFNTYLARYALAHPGFVRFQKGIYFKSVPTPFGYAGIKYDELIRRVYISDGKSVYGYETGPSLMNKLGLTTQLPAHTYIATEKVHFSVDGGRSLVLTRPVTAVRGDNFRYLQLLDILENRFNVRFDAVDAENILREFIKRHNLEFETLLYHARAYKSARVYERLAALAGEKYAAS